MPVTPRFERQQGYSLLEVMIGILILSVGILGMATMQLSAKKVGFDSMQRSIAITLAHDMLERLRSNPASASQYNMNNLGDGKRPVPTVNCFINTCNTTQIVAHDLFEWEQLLIGAAETIGVQKVGGLVNPRACILTNNGITTVTIAWKGFQSGETPPDIPCGLGLGLYGDQDSERQIVTISTELLVTAL